MTTITSTEYQDHPLNAVVRSSIQSADSHVSQVSEYTLNLLGMSGGIYRRFINNLTRQIPDVRYLEIGSWRGSTICAAIDGIENIYAVAIDNFSYDHSSFDEVNLNVNTVKTPSSTVQVFDADFNTFDYAKYAPFNVYMFDGPHEPEDHVNAITIVAPHLTDVAVIIIDDFNTYGGSATLVKDSTYQGFEKAGLEVLYTVEVETGVNPPLGNPSDWHNGCGIFVVRKKS